MPELKTTSDTIWTPTQAYILAGVCLLVGISTGWLIGRTLNTPQVGQTPPPVAGVVSPVQPNAPAFNPMPPGPSPEQLKQAADAQAAPLLEQLKAKPDDAAVLVGLGNIYYDSKQFAAAIDYYERALKIQPSNASVRTDLGTSYWYTGNADMAIQQFNKALSYEPNKPDTLFNLGIVQWQGKKNPQAAIASWQKLLASNPNYENRQVVEKLITQVKGT